MVCKPRWILLAVAVGALVVTSCETSPGDAVTIYGDGDISCPDHRADDQSLPVGTVVYQPGDDEIRVIITLTDAAPNAPYRVEVWSDESCTTGPLEGDDESPLIETDENGAGELDFVLTGVAAGTYRLNVNLCCGGEDELGRPEDSRHREMGTAQFTEVIVP